MPPGGQRTIGRHVVISLCAACTGCIGPLTVAPANSPTFASALPARGASPARGRHRGDQGLCLGAACTGCIFVLPPPAAPPYTLPRRCLHGVHRPARCGNRHRPGFASALPARGASTVRPEINNKVVLCLGAACTGCIGIDLRVRAHGELCLGAACTGCIWCPAPATR